MDDLNPSLYNAKVHNLKYSTKLPPRHNGARELNFYKRKLFPLPHSSLPHENKYYSGKPIYIFWDPSQISFKYFLCPLGKF